MDPVCFHIGGFTVHWFGVMMALGFSSGILVWLAAGRREGRDLAFCSDLLFWIMVSGVLGARAAYIISDWPHFASNPGMIFRLDKGGLIYYGGVAVSIIAVYAFARRRYEPPLGVFDFVAIALPLAHAFGRVGCFMNGCCHGVLYNGPLAVTFPKDSVPWYQHLKMKWITWDDPTSLPVYPVQLAEAALNLVVFGILLWIYKHRKRDGTTAAGYLLLYPVVRFVMEFFRGDERMVLGTLNTAQLISLILFAAGIVLLAFTRRSSRGQVAAGASGQSDPKAHSGQS